MFPTMRVPKMRSGKVGFPKLGNNMSSPKACPQIGPSLQVPIGVSPKAGHLIGIPKGGSFKGFPKGSSKRRSP